jgi:hypothetical protein
VATATRRSRRGGRSTLAGAAGLCGPVALGLGYATAKAWRAGESPLAERIGHATVALAFAALLSVWNDHREFFARYPTAGGWAVAINSVLHFTVLLYVYPLKLLNEVVAQSLLGAGPAALADMGIGEIRSASRAPE